MKFVVHVRITPRFDQVAGMLFTAHCGPIVIEDPIEIGLFGWYLETVLAEKLMQLSFLPFEGEKTLQPGDFILPVILDLDIHKMLSSQESYGVGTYRAEGRGEFAYYVRVLGHPILDGPTLCWLDEKDNLRQSHNSSQMELLAKPYIRVG